MQEICDDVHKAIESVGKKHGVVLARGRSLYSNESTGTIKIEIAALSDNGVVMDKYRAEWLDLAKRDLLSSRGLKPEWLDKQFTTHQGTFTIYGLSPTRSKYGVQCRRVDNGKLYGFPYKTIEMHLTMVEQKRKEVAERRAS